jgi:hypothetical protein
MDHNEPNALVPKPAYSIQEIVQQVVLPFVRQQDPSCTLNELRPEAAKLVEAKFPGAVEWLRQLWEQPFVIDPLVIRAAETVSSHGASLLQAWRGDLTPMWGPLLVEPTSDKWRTIGTFSLELLLTVDPDIFEDPA